MSRSAQATPAILPKWGRRTRSLDALLPVVYGHHSPDYQSEIVGGRVDRVTPGLHGIVSTHYHPGLPKRAVAFLTKPVVKVA